MSKSFCQTCGKEYENPAPKLCACGGLVTPYPEIPLEKRQGYVNGDSILSWLCGYSDSPLLPHESIKFSEDGRELSPDAEAEEEQEAIDDTEEDQSKKMGNDQRGSCGVCAGWREVQMPPLRKAVPKRGSVRRSLSLQSR